MLRCENLSKKYGRNTALDRFSCTFHIGVYGILGPNGAGKSTLLNLLSRVIPPTDGRIMWDDVEIRNMKAAYRSLLGVCPQDPPMYPWMRGREYLSYLYKAKELPAENMVEEIDRRLADVELTEWADQRIKTYSGGMRQRLGIAQSLMGGPRILLLDEPTAGLDPRQRALVKSLIRRTASQSIVLFCTHIVSDLTALANSILLLQKGVLIDIQSPENLLDPLKGKVWWVPESEGVLIRHPNALSTVRNNKPGLRYMADTAGEAASISVEPTLEDLYLFYFREANK